MNKKDLKIEYMRGTGPGGQHRNKTSSACRITHIPTGISAYADERSQHTSRKKALQELKNRLVQVKLDEKAQNKKEKRDKAIHDTKRIRTYDYKKQIVYDHRTNKQAPLKEVLEKGKIELLW